MCYQTFSRTEKPLRYDRMSGLDSEQLDELVWRIDYQLEEPWHKGIGHPKGLTLREAAVVACGYMRQNITQGSLGGNIRYVAAGDLWNNREVHTAYPGVHRRGPADRRRGKGSCGPRADGAGRRLPGAHLVLARYTRTMVGKP